MCDKRPYPVHNGPGNKFTDHTLHWYNLLKVEHSLVSPSLVQLQRMWSTCLLYSDCSGWEIRYKAWENADNVICILIKSIIMIMEKMNHYWLQHMTCYIPNDYVPDKCGDDY